jgi:hypothetical protein
VGQAVVDLVLGPKVNRGVVTPAAQQVLGEIERCVGKPLRLLDTIAVDQDTLALVADDATKIPDLGPERRDRGVDLPAR